MSIKKNTPKELQPFQELDELELEFNKRLNHLLVLLESSDLDSRKAALIAGRVDQALKKASVKDHISAYKALDQAADSRLEMLDNLSVLLKQNPVNSADTRKYLKRVKFTKVVQFMISLLLLTLGLGIIILPTPGEFEMFTIFHFTEQDGVTLMDIIALAIVFTGVYLLVDSLTKRRDHEFHEY